MGAERDRVAGFGHLEDGLHTEGDVLMSIQVTNAGPEAETIHVLPTAWFRNTWSWGDEGPRPGLRASGDRSVAIEHPFAGTLELLAGAAIGASHQTGWTGLIADVILRRHGAVRPLGDVLRDPAGPERKAQK